MNRVIYQGFSCKTTFAIFTLLLGEFVILIQGKYRNFVMSHRTRKWLM